MKTIHDIMDKSDKALEAFFEICDDMSESKFILAEKKISELLQLIAGSKKLYDIVNVCTQNYNFAKELMRALREENGKNWLEFSHMTPSERIAFTFCLLYSFDTHKIDLQNFVHKHFPNENINLEFSAFCKKVIMQFKADVKAKHSGIENNTPPIQNEELTLDSVPDYFVEFAKSKEIEPYREAVDHRLVEGKSHHLIYITKQQHDYLVNISVQVREKLGEISQKLSNDSALECSIMLEAFERAVMYGNLNLIQSALIGFKNTLKATSHPKAFTSIIESLSQFEF